MFSPERISPVALTVFCLCLYSTHLSASDKPDNSAEFSLVRKTARKEGLLKYFRDVVNILSAAGEALTNPALTIPFLTGPVYYHVPHMRASTPAGHLSFSRDTALRFTREALKTKNGVLTYWAGPYPVIYIARNEARKALIRESVAGIVDEASGQYLNWISGGNKVMTNFPAFSPFHSGRYRHQRRFLMKQYHAGAAGRLREVVAVTSSYLEKFREKYGDHSVSLRDFVTGIVLNSSSCLLGLGGSTLDQLISENSSYKEALLRVARYGIAERADENLEDVLCQLFIEVVRENFESIADPENKRSFIRNLTESVGVPFPSGFNEFLQTDRKLVYFLAMNFASTGLGAMVHSTTSTLDWALARLIHNPEKMKELVSLMEDHRETDLSEAGVFDKSGPLFPVAEWVLENVFLHPPFSHEFFLCLYPFSATLPDGQIIEVPAKSFIIVNYLSCNRSQESFQSTEGFRSLLQETATTGKFVMDSRVASFGGSDTGRENRHSRRCPGAKISLYEQMIIVSLILRDYSLQSTDALGLEPGPEDHPLHLRENRGTISLKQKRQLEVDDS